jgi:hypothetical protein
LEGRARDRVVLARIFAGDRGEDFSMIKELPMIKSQNGIGLFVGCFFWN